MVPSWKSNKSPLEPHLIYALSRALKVLAAGSKVKLALLSLRKVTPSENVVTQEVDDIVTYQIVGRDTENTVNALQRVYDTDPTQEGYQEDPTSNFAWDQLKNIHL